MFHSWAVNPGIAFETQPEVITKNGRENFQRTDRFCFNSQRGRSAAVRDVRSHHSVQSPDGMSTNDGVSSVPSSTVDSGYTPSSAATPDNASGGLWNQLGEGMTSTSPSSSRNPGAFLFGGKVGGAHNEVSKK